MRIMLGELRTLVREEVMGVRLPKTPRQKEAMIELAQHVAGGIVSHKELRDAVEEAQRENWGPIMDLLSTYYFMRGIQQPKPRYRG